MMQGNSDIPFASTDLLIAGGGASGTLLLMQLLRNPSFKGNITVVNNRYPFGRGIAYSTIDDEHLLNVRAGRMSAFPDKPDDFVDWIRSHTELKSFDGPTLSEKFVPRKYYGEYLLQRLEETLRQNNNHARVQILEDEITDVVAENQRYRAVLGSGKELSAAAVVLATGNTPPEVLPGYSDLLSDDRIRVNPWDDSQFDHLQTDKDVLVLGSSLTMADTVLSLKKRGFTGKIYVISRHGKLPVTHPAERPHGHKEIVFEPSKDLNILYRQIKERIRDVIHDLHWQEPVLEAIRPHTQVLWQQFTADQKLRFLRHLNHRWAILRHRIPAEVSSQLAELTRSGQLHIHAGQLLEIETNEPMLRVKFMKKPENIQQQIEVQRLFNCTGPEGNPEKNRRPLIKQLLKRGMLRADELKLGFDALPDGCIIGKDGKVTPRLFTLGPGLRGILWESTAIPEIRSQAVQLAQNISILFNGTAPKSGG